MKTIKVPDMMCENCVKRITNALTEAELKFNVSLADKTVTIDGCEHCLKTAMEELEDLGFSPEAQAYESLLFQTGRCIRLMRRPFSVTIL